MERRRVRRAACEKCGKLPTVPSASRCDDFTVMNVPSFVVRSIRA